MSQEHSTDKVGFLLSVPYKDAQAQVHIADHLWVFPLDDPKKNTLLIDELVSNAKIVHEFVETLQEDAPPLCLSQWYVSMEQLLGWREREYLSQTQDKGLGVNMGPSVLEHQLIGCIQVLLCDGNVPDARTYQSILMQTKVGFAALERWGMHFQGVSMHTDVGPLDPKIGSKVRMHMMFDDGQRLARLYSNWEALQLDSLVQKAPVVVGVDSKGVRSKGL